MNRRLLIAVWIFVIVAFVGLLLALSAVEQYLRGEAAIEAARQATGSSIYLTNTVFVLTGPFVEVETAKPWTPTASPTLKIAQTATSGK